MLLATTAMAQEAIHQQRTISSPVVNNDGTVTFRIQVPNAKEVKVTGDFLPKKRMQHGNNVWEVDSVATMQPEGKGVWSYTTGEGVDPELYSYHFIVDGTEVLDPSNFMRSRDGRRYTSNFIVSRSANDTGWYYQTHDVKHGTLSAVWYDSPTLGMQRRMKVYTPAGYEKGGKYPVMYLLHGMMGDEEAWSTLGRSVQILDNLIAEGKAQPMIVVMPNGNDNVQASPEADSPFSGTLNTRFIESFPDIMAYMKANYRIKEGADNTAICGLSMGGNHTFGTSKMLPGKFGYIGLFSAAVTLSNSRKSTYDLLQESEVQTQLAQLFASKPHLYWIAIGKDDFLYQQNADLRRYLDEKGYKYEYRESTGGHIWRNWRIYLREFAEKIFK